MKRTFFIAWLSLCVSGCATHQLRFQPWKGIPQADLADVQRGVFDVPKDKLFDAAAATLEHEPFLHWTFDTLDKGNGLMVGSAGLFREIQIRVTDAEGPSTGSGQARSRMAVSIPRRELKSQAKIFILAKDPSQQTAYEPDALILDKYNVQAADAKLENDYFYSFTYRVLHDRTQVPFKLQAYEDAQAQGWAPEQDSAPTPAVAAPVAASATASTMSAAPATAVGATPTAQAASTPSAKPTLPAAGGVPTGSTSAAEGAGELPPAHRE